MNLKEEASVGDLPRWRAVYVGSTPSTTEASHALPSYLVTVIKAPSRGQGEDAIVNAPRSLHDMSLETLSRKLAKNWREDALTDHSNIWEES